MSVPYRPYGLIRGLAGVRYDAVERVLQVEPRLPGDFRSFLSTATGYAMAGVRSGEPFFEVCAGKIDVARIDYRPLA